MRINNRRYLGNKYKLLDFIKETVEENCSDVRTVFDVFAGTGSVSSAFINKELIINDILYSNYLTHICWFSNENYDEEKVKELIDKYNRSKPKKENYMSINFSNTFFSHDISLKIGYIRQNIETQFNNKKINFKEKAMLITSLLYACDKIANNCGHYDAYIIGAKYNNDFFMEYPEQFKDKKNNTCYCMDSNRLAPSVFCDLAYLDPPYNSRQYSDAYHLLENIARWEKPQVEGVARKMDRKSIKSDYCTTKATHAFEDLVHKLNCRYILLSYNNTADKANERSNAKLKDEDIIRILSSRGEVTLFSKHYKAFTTGLSDNNENEERLFLCKVNNSIIQSPLNYTGGKAKLYPQIRPFLPIKINTFVDLFCGGCNVGINTIADKHIYNDNNDQLINLLNIFKTEDINGFITDIDNLISKYELSKSDLYGYDYYNADSNNGLSHYNKNKYLKLRSDFNNRDNRDNEYYKMLYLLIIYAFNNQIRFNSKGDFNLPVGKRDFNKMMRLKVTSFMECIKKQNAEFVCNDFRTFKIEWDKDDFVYCDPPYLITTASYNEQNGWTERDEKDLLKYLDHLNKINVKFALSNVLKHKGKTNKILTKWAEKNKYNVHHLNFNYNNSNYHGTNTDKETDEVLITNY